MADRLKKIISDKRVLLTIYILFALAATIQSLLTTNIFDSKGVVYTGYNNYVIFEKSFEHLKDHKDLYILYLGEHWDLYKYTPSFSVFFGIFHAMPDWLGLGLWSLLNALVLFLAVHYLPRLSNFHKGLILTVVLIELMTSLQNNQSNALIAGLIILSFGLLEKNKAFWAALCIVFSVFIKLFGIVGFALFLFYPGKWKSALYTLFWAALLLALPLAFVNLSEYSKLLNSYLNLLTNDHDTSYGFSVMGWLYSWFSVELSKNSIVAAGIIIFLLPFCRIKCYKEFMFRYLVLCSTLIWIVIFNHKAESPTFIIAMTGVALWFTESKKSTLNIILFIGAIILTSLSPTDIFPKYIRDDYVKPYALKALPCILIWIKIIYDMITMKKEENSEQHIADAS